MGSFILSKGSNLAKAANLAKVANVANAANLASVANVADVADVAQAPNVWYSPNMRLKSSRPHYRTRLRAAAGRRNVGRKHRPQHSHHKTNCAKPRKYGLDQGNCIFRGT